MRRLAELVSSAASSCWKLRLSSTFFKSIFLSRYNPLRWCKKPTRLVCSWFHEITDFSWWNRQLTPFQPGYVWIDPHFLSKPSPSIHHNFFATALNNIVWFVRKEGKKSFVLMILMRGVTCVREWDRRRWWWSDRNYASLAENIRRRRIKLTCVFGEDR